MINLLNRGATKELFVVLFRLVCSSGSSSIFILLLNSMFLVSIELCFVWLWLLLRSCKMVKHFSLWNTKDLLLYLVGHIMLPGIMYTNEGICLVVILSTGAKDTLI